MQESKLFRVLSIDGGGMRGLYAATYLSSLACRYATTRGEDELDIGKGFDLITGTSTGAVIACALVAGVPLGRIATLYQEQGSKIFPVKLPQKMGLNLALQMWTRPKYLKAGAVAIKDALQAEFGDITLGDIWVERQIGLAIPAIEMSHHHPWVFKTPHLPKTKHRDDNYRLVDVCLAATAAPIYRSMARIKSPITSGSHVFVDGGLWANNPVLIGLADALEMTDPKDRIETFCLGTCSRPEGEIVNFGNLDRGLMGWKFGGQAMMLAVNAQESAFDEIAQMVARHVTQDCQIIRFPHGHVPAEGLKYLDLDATNETAINVLVSQAQADIIKTLSLCGKTSEVEGQLLNDLFNSIPPKAGTSDDP